MCRLEFFSLTLTLDGKKSKKKSLEKIFKISYLSCLASHLICWIHVWWSVSNVVSLHLIHISHSDSISLSLDTFLLSFCSSSSRFISSHIFFSPTSQLCVSRVWILPRHASVRFHLHVHVCNSPLRLRQAVESCAKKREKRRFVMKLTAKLHLMDVWSVRGGCYSLLCNMLTWDDPLWNKKIFPFKLSDFCNSIKRQIR